MNICFSGFEGDIEIRRGEAAVLEVSNRVLFARVCDSIVSGAGDRAVEPYVIWDSNGKGITASNAFLVVDNPLVLPWDDRSLSASMPARFEQLLLEDEQVRAEIELAFKSLRSKMNELALQMHSDYAFEIDWEVRRFLKSFGFGVELNESDLLIDKIIKFLLFAEDVRLKRTIVFVNLKLFLSESDLNRVFDQVFFQV